MNFPLPSTRSQRVSACWIAANLAFFAALLVAMFYTRHQTQIATGEWPSPFHFPSLLMGAALLMFAACASVTMHVGARASKLEDREPAVRWIAIAISCWFVFLFLEIVEWVRLVYLEELGPGTPFGSTFLVLTGTHWLGALVALSWFVFVAVNVRKRDAMAAAMYSHFLNVWWVVLFFALYVPNATLDGI